MKRTRFTPREVAFFVALTLSVPSSAFALRTSQPEHESHLTGLEEALRDPDKALRHFLRRVTTPVSPSIHAVPPAVPTVSQVGMEELSPRAQTLDTRLRQVASSLDWLPAFGIDLNDPRTQIGVHLGAHVQGSSSPPVLTYLYNEIPEVPFQQDGVRLVPHPHEVDGWQVVSNQPLGQQATRQHQVDWVLVSIPLDTPADRLEETLQAIQEHPRVRFVSVTQPHKVAVGQWVQEWDPRVVPMRTTNHVFIRRDEAGRFLGTVGTNSDGPAFVQQYKKVWGRRGKQPGRFQDKKIVLLGGWGGLGQAITVSILKEWRDDNPRAIVLIESSERVEAAKKEMWNLFGQINLMRGVWILSAEDRAVNAHIESADLLINATGIGMDDDRSPVSDASVFSRNPYNIEVIDSIYRTSAGQPRPVPPLLRQAWEAGVRRVFNGVGLYVRDLSWEADWMAQQWLGKDGVDQEAVYKKVYTWARQTRGLREAQEVMDHSTGLKEKSRPPFTLSGLDKPTGVSYDPVAQRVFVTESGSNRLRAFDVASGLPTGLVIEGLDDPSGVAYDPGDGRLFIAERTAMRLRAFDADTGRPTGLVIKNIELPSGVAFDSVTQTLYVTEGTHPGQIRTFNAATGQPTGWVVEDLLKPVGVAYDSNTKTLFVTEYLASRLRGFHAGTGQPTGLVVGDLFSPSGVAYAPETQTLFVADSPMNRLRVFDAQTGLPIHWEIQDLSEPLGVFYEPTAQALLIAEYGAGRLRAFSAVDGRPTAVPRTASLVPSPLGVDGLPVGQVVGLKQLATHQLHVDEVLAEEVLFEKSIEVRQVKSRLEKAGKKWPDPLYPLSSWSVRALGEALWEEGDHPVLHQMLDEVWRKVLQHHSRWRGLRERRTRGFHGFSADFDETGSSYISDERELGMSEILHDDFLKDFLSNAIDAVIDRWSTDVDSMEIRFRSFIKEGALWIQVLDNGTGILPEILGQIGKERMTTKRKRQGFGGAGQGLYRAAATAQEHGWQLVVANRSGTQGASASVVIPLDIGLFRESIPTAGLEERMPGWLKELASPEELAGWIYGLNSARLGRRPTAVVFHPSLLPRVDDLGSQVLLIGLEEQVKAALAWPEEVPCRLGLLSEQAGLEEAGFRVIPVLRHPEAGAGALPESALPVVIAQALNAKNRLYVDPLFYTGLEELTLPKALADLTDLYA